MFRENAEGRIYGITFINNATGTVFNGSSLGKEYAAKAFLARMPGNNPPEGNDIRPEEEPAEKRQEMAGLSNDYLNAAGSAILKITDAFLKPVEEYDEPSLLRRRKKKRKNELSQS